MGPKMLTEHAQMHAGKCENPKGKLGNGKSGGVNKKGVKIKTLN